MQCLGAAAAGRVASREPDPATVFEQQCRVKLVRDALAELRPQVAQRDFEAFTLRWVDGLSVREIAGRLGMTESQIWSSHHRMRCKLRPLLFRRLNGGPDSMR